MPTGSTTPNDWASSAAGWDRKCGHGPKTQGHGCAFDRFHHFPAATTGFGRRLVLLGTIDSGRISSDKTSRMEPSGVVRSATTVMIATTVGAAEPTEYLWDPHP